MWMITLLIKPLVLFVFFVGVAMIAQVFFWLMPDSKLKRKLFTRIN